MKYIQRIAIPAYGVAAIMVAFAAMELTQALLPLRPGDPVWRLSAMGLFSRSLATPILALLLAYVVALVLEQPRVLRGLAVLKMAVAVLICAGLAFYVLDALQVRPQVSQQTRMTFDAALAMSFLKYGAGLAFLVGLAINERATAALMTHRPSSHAASAPLVVRPSSAHAAATPSDDRLVGAARGD